MRLAREGLLYICRKNVMAFNAITYDLFDVAVCDRLYSRA